MQNEELQRVFNISEHQNHRYNGFVLPTANDKYTIKPKKPSPKPKKHMGLDTVTDSGKNFIKRRSRVKNSTNKPRESVIVNGVNPVNSILPKPKEYTSFADKYRNNTLNNFNKSYESNDVNSVESISSILSSLSKDLNSNNNSNNRVRLANPLKYTEVNHRSTDTSTTSTSGINYVKTFGHFSGIESEPKLKTNHVNNFTTSKFTSPTALSKNKFTETRKKDEELPCYLPEVSTFKTIAPNNSQFDEKPDLRFIERNKTIEKDVDRKVPELSGNKVCENKLFLRAKKRKQNSSKWQMDNGTRHEALQRIRNSVELQENLQNDLFPLNIGETVFEKSDSDSSEEYYSTFQNNWFHSMAEIEFDDVKRSFRLGQLYNELRRQWYQIKKNKYEVPIFTNKFMKSLVDTARTQPSDALCSLEENENLLCAMAEPIILAKKKCSMESCKNVALPCMPTCVRHILHCEKQTLFEQCRVRDSNELQCDKPVLNIKYHYPVCSLHSKPDFVLPDFSREDIKYEDVRNKNTSSSSDIYKTDFDFTTPNTISIKPINTSSILQTTKKKNQNGNAGKIAPAVRTHLIPEKKEKGEKKIFEKPVKPMKNGELPRKPTIVENNDVLHIKEEPKPSTVPTVNQNLLRDWVGLADGQLVDAKTLENTLQNEFVNGFDINASTIQSQIQDIINSESSLSTDMLMGSHELPSYIQVEEMIEEVEITDETLESGELNNHELVHSEDLNAVLKQLPPEAFNELFSDKNDSHWGETQALERVIEEMDVRKCALIDPSLLLEDIEPSYSNYSNNYDSSALTENIESKYNDLTQENCSQSQS